MTRAQLDLLDDVLNASAAAAQFEAIENIAERAADRDFFTFGAGEEDGLQGDFIRRMRKLAAQARVARKAFEARARRAGNALLDGLAPRNKRSPPQASLTDDGLLDAFDKNPGWELSRSSDPDEEADQIWQLHQCSGGRNDREWLLLGNGATARDAIHAALARQGASK